MTAAEGTATKRRAAPAALAFAPPLLLMALIWFLSAQSDLSTGLGLIDLIGRKIVHFLSYALLCFLWWRALRGHFADAAALATAFAIAVAYAAVDEYHQSFVEGRTGSPIDVAIDAAGAAATVVLVQRRRAFGPAATASRAR
jgi:VanZ family protein